MDASPNTPPSPRPWRRFVLCAFALVLLLFTKSEPLSWADASRLGTIQALVEDHSLALDNTAYLWQGDKVYIGEHFYSHQPPMMALLGAIPYSVLHMAGRAIDAPGTYKLLTLCLVGLPMLLGLAALGRMARRLGAPEIAAAAIMASAAFASLALPYSLVLNQHGLAAALVLLGLEAATHKRALVAGALLALATTVDLTAVFFAVALIIPLVWRTDEDKPHFEFPAVLPYAIAALPILALHFGVSFAITGDFKPAGLHTEAFHYPLSPFVLMSLTGSGASGPDGSALAYAQGALFGESGLFSLCPLLLIALFLGVKSWRTAPTARPIISAILLGSLGITAFYLTSSRNFGGSAFGMRWFTVFAPALLLIAAPALARADKLRWSTSTLLPLFAALFIFSASLSSLGAVQPWTKFHWRFEDSPEGMVAGPTEERPTRTEYLKDEWQRITNLQEVFTEDRMDELYKKLIDQHRKLYLQPLTGVDKQVRRDWITGGMQKLRHAVDLLDRANSRADSRAVGHFWLGKFHLALGQRQQAIREFEVTLILAPTYSWAKQALRGLEKLGPQAQ